MTRAVTVTHWHTQALQVPLTGTGNCRLARGGPGHTVTVTRVYYYLGRADSDVTRTAQPERQLKSRRRSRSRGGACHCHRSNCSGTQAVRVGLSGTTPAHRLGLRHGVASGVTDSLPVSVMQRASASESDAVRGASARGSTGTAAGVSATGSSTFKF